MTSIILFLVLASIVEAQVQNFGQQENENNSGDVRTTAQSGPSTVIVLAVALSLGLIFAVAGIFIGIYCRVEQILCCCCQKCCKKAQKIDTDSTHLQQKQKLEKNPDVYMTTAAAMNLAYKEDKSSEIDFSSIKINGGAKDLEQLAHKSLFNTKRHFKKRKRDGTFLTSKEPFGFGASTTHISEDGALVRVVNKEDKKNVIENQKDHCHVDIRLSYQTFSMQNDDILF